MVVDALAQVRQSLATVAAAPAWSLSDTEVRAALAEAHATAQTASAVMAHLVRQAESRGMPRTDAATSTATWLRHQLRMSIHAAKRLVELSHQLDEHPDVDATLAAGHITIEQATVITDAVDALPAEVGPDLKTTAEQALIGHAARFEPGQLRRLGERILTHLDPDAADRAALNRLHDQQARADSTRTLALTHTGDGRIRLTGWLDTEAAAVVTAAIDPLCRPTPDDRRNPGQRRADALADVCRLALATTSLPDNGGERPHLVVTVPYDVLTRQLGTGMLDTGEHLTPAHMRRLACDAHIIPAVLGANSQLLDLGRTRRLFTGPVRRALVLRDGGCAFPDCDRPATWCQAHHIRPWWAGGTTCPDNGVLLCGPHHRAIHHDGWTVQLAGDKRPEFLPPPWIDPDRRPRRNTYHRRT